MSTKQTLSTLLAILLVMLCSCNDDDTPTNGGHHSIQQLPSQVGMLWKYQVYDSLTQTTDTVWVSVTEGRPSIPELTVFVWRMYWTARDSVVWRDISFRGDTVEIYTDTVQTEPDLLEWFVFPLEVGREWVLPYGVDTSRVAEVGTIRVPAGTFSSAARVERVWDTDFEGGGNWSTTWVARNVGIVSRHFFSQFNPGGGVEVTMNQTWKLYDYDLSTFSLNQFPNSIGTEWVYQLVDTLLDLVDTVTVRVVGKIQAQPYDSMMVWAYEGREYVDTMFIAVDDQRVTEFFDTLVVMPFVAWQYEFPMAVGRHWGIETFAPIPEVDDKAPVITPYRSFGSGFHYRMGGGWFNDYWSVEDWLVPGVGVATRKFTRWGLGPNAHQEWTLLSYQPPH
jgi:hypothetical protein